MAPVFRALQGAGLEPRFIAAAQHREMLDQALDSFGIRPDVDLDAMRPAQRLSDLTAILVPALDRVISDSDATAVLAQGDSATVLCTALASYYAKVPFGHVEAGLRTGKLFSPFPEEGTRRLAAVVARWHFAPTEAARRNLLSEGHPAESIHVVGNTVIDALLSTLGAGDLPWPPGVPLPGPGVHLALLTLHRREVHGSPLEQMVAAVRGFLRAHPEVVLVWPVHPNPKVAREAQALRDEPNVRLVPPLGYRALLALLSRCELVLTDSGGLQEEAPALGKPVLVLRDETERPEGLTAGSSRLVGTEPHRIRAELEAVWGDKALYASMAVPRFPFGEGGAAARIAQVLAADLPEAQPREKVG
jgi:UDP-N-acetylglucosamine 2-epimerase (non-hydrolysing)